MTLQQAFLAQSRACTRLGSPFMGQLCRLLAQHWPCDSQIAQSFLRFEGDLGPDGHSLPLRLAGGLHALVLSDRAPMLAESYPPNDVGDEILLQNLLRALDEHAPFLSRWVERPPQTNEVRRSALLIAGAHVALQHFDVPIHLSELGASGGLNLMWDHYALVIDDMRYGPDDAVVTLTPDWTGPLPPPAHPKVATRAGVDLNPLDPAKKEDLLRLIAYLWPDQPTRLKMTRAAASVATAPVFAGDAIEWLEQRLQNAPAGQLHLIQHTVAWQYFPKSAQVRGHQLIAAAGQNATAERPLAWLSMETDGEVAGKNGAALTLRLWPGNYQINLGRADFHGRWVRWAYDDEKGGGTCEH
ncbi:MAG: DUF2332 family protein [Pseudomonadota bacterium]